MLEAGADWFIFLGNLGFEFWALEVAKELQEDYDVMLATIFAFENQGENWNETNQEKLDQFKQVDFIKYSFKDYQNPSQFRQYNQFLISNSDGAYLFYDEENETNIKFIYQLMKEKDNYFINQLRFEDLNDIAQDEG